MAPKKSKTGNIGTFTGSEFKDILSEILEDDPNVNSKNGVVTATINVDGNASKEMEQISEDTKEAAKSMKDLGETAEKTGKTISDSFDQASRKVSKDIEDIGKKVQKIYKSFGKNNSLKDIELGFTIDDDSVGKIDKQLKNKVKSVVNNTNRELDAYKNSLKEFADIGTNYKASGRTNDEVKSLYMSSDFTARLYNADEVKEASKKYIEQLDTSDKRIINYIQNREALYSSLKNLESQVDLNTTDFSDTEKNKSMIETMSKMTKIAKMIEHVDGLIKDRNGKYKNENPIDVNNYIGMLNSFYEKMTSPEVLSQKFEKQFQEMQEVIVEFIGYISKVKVSDGVIDASPILEKVNKTADKSKKKVQEVVQEVKEASDYISDATKLEGKALTNWNNLNKEKGTKSVSKANQYEFVGQIANVLRNGGKLKEDSKAFQYYLQLLKNPELEALAESIKNFKSANGSGVSHSGSNSSAIGIDPDKVRETSDAYDILAEKIERAKQLGIDISQFASTSRDSENQAIETQIGLIDELIAKEEKRQQVGTSGTSGQQSPIDFKDNTGMSYDEKLEKVKELINYQKTLSRFEELEEKDSVEGLDDKEEKEYFRLQDRLLETESVFEEFKEGYKGLKLELKDGSFITATANSLENLLNIKPGNIKNITMEYTELQHAFVKLDSLLEDFDAGSLVSVFGSKVSRGEIGEFIDSVMYLENPVKDLQEDFDMTEKEATEFYNKITMLNKNLFDKDGNITKDNSVINTYNEVANIVQEKYKKMATSVISAFEEMEKECLESGLKILDYIDSPDFWKKDAQKVIDSPISFLPLNEQQGNKSSVLSGNQTEVLSGDAKPIQETTIAINEQANAIDNLRKMYDDLHAAFDALPKQKTEQPEEYIYDYTKAKDYVDFKYDGEDTLPSVALDYEAWDKAYTERLESIREAIQLTVKQIKEMQNAVDKHGGHIGDNIYDERDIENAKQGLMGLFEMYAANDGDLDSLNVKLTKPFKAMVETVKEAMVINNAQKEQYDAETKAILENNKEQIQSYEKLYDSTRKAFEAARSDDKQYQYHSPNLPWISTGFGDDEYAAYDEDDSFEQVCRYLGIEIPQAAEKAEQAIREVTNTPLPEPNQTPLSSDGTVDTYKQEEQASNEATETVVENEKKKQEALKDYISLYLELKKLKETGKPVDPKIVGKSGYRPVIKPGYDPEFDAEQQMKSLEEEVLSLYGENLAKLAEEHLSAADAARKHADSEKELHEAQEANKSPISSEAKVEEITEEVKELTQAEKEAAEYAERLGRVLGITNKKALASIRDKIYEYRQSPEADLKTDKDGLLIADTITDEFEFFAKTGTSFNEVLAEISKHIRTGKNDVDAYAEKWKQVRDYVSKSRLYISETDKEDLGNDYSRVMSTIGRNHIVTEKMRQDKGLELSQSGYNIIELLSEMNDQLGTTFNLTNSTQDAFIELYEFLKDKPLKFNVDGLPENIRNTVDEILNDTFTSYKWSSPKISNAKFNQSSKSNDATDKFVQNEKKKEQASSDATDTIVNNERKQQEEQQKTADEEKQSAKKKHNYEIIKAVRNKDGSWSDTFQDGIGRTFEEGERVDQEGNLHRYWRELTNYTQLEKEAVKYTNQLALAYADLEKEQRKATPDTYVLQTIVDQIDLLESRLQDVKDQAIAYDGEKDPQYDYALFEKRVSKEADEYALKLQVKTANEIRQENEANLKAIERQNKELEKSNSFLSKQKIELRKIRQDSDSKLEAKKGILNNDRVAEADRKVLQDLYDNINRKINDYETSNHKLSRKEKDTLIEEIAELKLKKLELQNKYYGSTSLSPTELDDNKSILTSNYDLLISRAKEAGTYTKDLVKSLNDQRKAIDNIQDSNGVKVFTDHLKAARAEFVKLKQEAHEKQAKNDKTYEEKYDAIKKYADERDYLNQLLTEEIRLGKSDELTQKIDAQTKKCKSLRLEAEKAKNVISGMLQGGVISKRKANAATGLFENVINGRRSSFGVLRSAQASEDKKAKQAQDRADAQAKKQKEKADRESNARKYAEDIPYLRSEVEKLLKLLNEDSDFGVFQSIEEGTKGTTITFMKELEDSTKKTIVTVKDLWEVWNSLENGTFKAKSAGEHSTKNIKRTDVEKAYKTLADNEERRIALEEKDKKGTATPEQIEELKKLNAEKTKAENITKKKTATTEAEIKAQERWNEVSKKSAELAAQFESHEEQVKDLLSSSNNSFKDFEKKLTKDDGTKADSTINYYRKQIEDLNNDLQTGKVSIEKYNEEFLKISQNMKNTVIGGIGADQARSEMKNLLIQMGAAESEIGTFDEKNQTLTATFRNQNGELEKVVLQYNALTKSIEISKKSVDRIESGLLKFAKGIKGKFEGIGQYVMMYLGFNDIIRYIREGITVVRELDTALTEMKKVSDETTGSLQRFQKASFEIADSIGSTAEQIQNSAADFMRLGKDLETASKLAEHANIYANVGDMGIEEATSHMVSSIQAWKSEFSSEVEASASIIDRYNEIGNNFAITSADIGSAMERSAAALKEGGNTLNEALGLITAGI